MSNLPTAPAPAPLSRFEAQKALGLFAAHDYVMGTIIVLLALGLVSYSIFGSYFDPLKALCVLALMLVFAQIWLIALVYRAMVFILDLHSDVALMPEASARIAVGFLQGKPVTK